VIKCLVFSCKKSDSNTTYRSSKPQSVQSTPLESLSSSGEFRIIQCIHEKIYISTYAILISVPGNRKATYSDGTALTTPTLPSQTPNTPRGFSRGTVKALAAKFNTADVVSTFLPSPTKSPKKTDICAGKDAARFCSSPNLSRKTVVNGDDLYAASPTRPSSLYSSKKTSLNNCSVGPASPIKTLKALALNDNNMYLLSLDPCELPTSPELSANENKVYMEFHKTELIAQYTTNQPSPAKSHSSNKSVKSIRPAKTQASPDDRNRVIPIARAITPRRLIKDAFNDSTPLRPVTRNFRDNPLFSSSKRESFPIPALESSLWTTPRHSSLRKNGILHIQDGEFSKARLPELSPGSPIFQCQEQQISAANCAAMEVPMSLRCVGDNICATTTSSSNSPCPTRAHFQTPRLSSPVRLVGLSSEPPTTTAPVTEINCQPCMQPPALIHVVEVHCPQSLTLASVSGQRAVELDCTQASMHAPTYSQTASSCCSQQSHHGPKPSTSNKECRSPIEPTSTRSSSVLHGQIQELQQQVDAKAEEIRQLKQQLNVTGASLGIAGLSEQLRIAKREAQEWKSRAEVAEKQIEALTQFSSAKASSPVKKLTTWPRLMDGYSGSGRDTESNRRNTKYSEDGAVVHERIRMALHGIEVIPSPLGMDGASGGSQRFSSGDSTDTVVRSFVISDSERGMWADKEVEPLDFIG
jgi:hypothetical protein